VAALPARPSAAAAWPPGAQCGWSAVWLERSVAGAQCGWSAVCGCRDRSAPARPSTTWKITASWWT